MKTLINILLTIALLASAIYWLGFEAKTEGGKIVRILLFLSTTMIWLNYAPIARKLCNHKIFDL